MNEPLLIDRYFLFREIAAGGMASIYLARLLGSVGFGRTVAIKRLHPQYARDPAFVAMFVDEARVVTCIRHPNVVPVLDVVSTPGHLFLVMEYVHGAALSRLVATAIERRLPIPPAVVSAIVIGVLEGLHAAHESKGADGRPLELVHRDVSPQNVLVGTDGIARVLDFGIAKAKSQLHETTTGSGMRGKLRYMPPEQLHGRVLDRRCDIWAVSVMLWELLAGQRLFAADNDGAVVLEIIEKPISPPSAIAGSPSSFDAVVMKGLARPLAERFGDARAMALALEAACRPASPREVGEWVERLAGPALWEREEMLRELEATASAGLPSARSQLAMIADHAARSDDVAAPPPSGSRPTSSDEGTARAGGRPAATRAARSSAPRTAVAGKSESSSPAAEDELHDRPIRWDELDPGQVLGSSYSIVRRLDRGGMGTVYEAVQLALGRRIAIKVLSDLTPRGAERFAQEALATAALQHPCVVQVTDFRPETDEEPAFLVMELLEGKSVAHLLRDEGKLDPARAIGITSQILSALAAAHRVGIIHRDIKPDNVFVVDHAGVALVKVLDFGIAKLIGDEGGVMTTTGAVFGSLPYMAPELLLRGTVDARADIYATSACLFEMLTGQRPFDGPTSKLSTMIVGAAAAPDVRTLRPDVPEALALAVARGLSKAPSDRFPSAAAMRDALAAASSDLDSSAALADAFARSLAKIPADGSRSSGVTGPSRDVAGGALAETESRTGRRAVVRSMSRPESDGLSVVVAPGRSRIPLVAGVSGAVLVTLGVAFGMSGAKSRGQAKPVGSSIGEVHGVVTSASVESPSRTPDGSVAAALPAASELAVASVAASSSAKPAATLPPRRVDAGPNALPDGVRLDHRK